MPELLTIGQGCLIKAIVSRQVKGSSSETCAKMISDCLPFIEYELHRQLLNKIKLKGMNTLYALRIQISLGENLLIGTAEATGAYTAALPQAKCPKLVPVSDCIKNRANEKYKQQELDELKTLMSESLNSNIEFFNIRPSQVNAHIASAISMCNKISNYTVPVNEFIDPFELEMFNNSNNSIIKIDLDDKYDKENVYLLLEPMLRLQKGVYLSNSEFVPGIMKLKSNYQMFVRVFRCETSLIQLNTKELNEILDRILLSLKYKFRNLKNYCLTNISFDISLYDDDHAMIIATGCCFDLGDKIPSSITEFGEKNHKEIEETNGKNHSPSERTFIEINTLSSVPGATIEQYLGHINLFLIRESTSIKEYGGLNGFMHCFINEMMALTRAHVLSLGGNALVCFKINESILLDNPHKNQGQCLLNLSGDAVKIKKNST